MNIGIFLPNWIGDTAMCTPALRALRRHYGDEANLVGIVRPYVADVLAGTDWLDEQILYHPRSRQPAERAREVLRQMRAHRFDAVVLFTNSFRTAAMAWASGARQRIGFVRNGRGLLLTHKLYEPRHGLRRLPMPQVDTYLQLTTALGCAPESQRLELSTLLADERAADAVWKKWNLPIGQQVVVLNCSGAYGAAKLWPPEHFARLARRIVREQGLSVLVACGPDERATSRKIAELANDSRVVTLADEPLSIGLTKACIRRSRLLVTTDSGPRFFAVAFGVPVITLFGPTDANWTRIHGANETYLHHDVPCGPCGKRSCPLGHHACMRDLSVRRVFAQVLEQLNVRLARAA